MDRDLYKTRHLIKNFFARLKRYRAIATRYDKTARSFLGAIHLAASVVWFDLSRALDQLQHQRLSALMQIKLSRQNYKVKRRFALCKGSSNGKAGAMSTNSTLFSPIALRAHRCFFSNDLEDARERISSVLQPHQLRPLRARPHFQAHMDAVRFGGSVIGALNFGDEMNVHVDSMDNYYLFLCTISGHAHLSVDEECTSIGTSAVACSMPDSAFSGNFSEDCEQFFLRVDRRTVEAHTGSSHIRFRPSLPFDNPGIRAWCAQMQLLATEANLLKLASQDLRVAHDLERMLLSLLMAGAICSGSATERRVSLAPHVVKRAEAFIEAHAQEAITLDDIAKAVDTTARTLQSAFQKFRGMTPMQALREHRLRLVHALLSSGQVANVTDAALQYGIAHLGRFAAIYAKQFGESPSKTLLRSRRH